jgi:hypothetical protein
MTESDNFTAIRVPGLLLRKSKQQNQSLNDRALKVWALPKPIGTLTTQVRRPHSVVGMMQSNCRRVGGCRYGVADIGFAR